MLRHGIFALVLAAVGFGCVKLGERGARAVERMLVARVGNGLAVLKIDWAEVRADGMRLELHGHAPDLFARELALESARATAPMAVVIDHTTANLAPPAQRDPVHIELLRDERGLTMTGRFYRAAMRSRLTAALAAAAPALEIHDLTGINAAQPGAGWGPELDIAALAAARVRNAYVRIEPGAVRVEGVARSAEHRRELTMELLALAGDRVRLTLQLREPLRVVAPYVFAASKDAAGNMRLEACTARDTDEQVRLEGVLQRLGYGATAGPGGGRCLAALGGPRGDWVGAVEAGLQALEGLPAGRLRLEYSAVRLDADAPTTAADLEAVLAALAMALPEGYGLFGALAEESARPVAGETRYWLRFSRTDDLVVLSGIAPDRTARRVIEAYAAAWFGRPELRSVMTLPDAGTGPDAVTPSGWVVAASVALDALGALPLGVAEVTPGRISVEGTVTDPAEAGRLHRLTAGEAPEGYVVSSALTVDLPAQVATVPLNAPRCAAELGAAVKARPIAFAPGSAVFAPGSKAALAELAGILERCAGGRIEIGGHTDSQGSENLNERLSKARAEAVLDALIARGIPLERLAARGYGEAHPVAGNDTEEGRALNRRIEFTALP